MNKKKKTMFFPSQFDNYDVYVIMVANSGK